MGEVSIRAMTRSEIGAAVEVGRLFADSAEIAGALFLALCDGTNGTRLPRHAGGQCRRRGNGAPPTE